MDKITTIGELKEYIKNFNLKRNWDKAHNPKDLILALMEEVGELASLFKWSKIPESVEKEKISEELADIFIYLLILSYKLDIDVSNAVSRKLKINEKRYPPIMDDKNKGKVILLTGIPATGKTTLAKMLAKLIYPLVCFDYGSLIIEWKKDKMNSLDYVELRKKSSDIVHVNDVMEIDKWLVEKVMNLRLKTNIVIDSHAVTSEKYGYRIIPFPVDLLLKLKFDAIIVLHSTLDTLNSRIEAKDEGRNPYSLHNYQRHTYLQDTLAEIYSVVSGCPVYIVNNDGSLDDLIDRILLIFKEIGVNYKVKKGRV